MYWFSDTFAIWRTVKSMEYNGSRQITISLTSDILSRRLHIYKCIKIKYSELMALLSAFFGFDSPRCLRWPSAGVCWLRGGPPACGSGSAQCQGRRGRGDAGEGRHSHGPSSPHIPLICSGGFPLSLSWGLSSEGILFCRAAFSSLLWLPGIDFSSPQHTSQWLF